MELKEEQIWMTKKGKKLVIDEVKEETVLVKLYVHRDSDNCKSYGWGHNIKWFLQWFLIEDKKLGLKSKLQNEGFKLK